MRTALLLLVCFVLAACASNDTLHPIRTTGTGPTIEAAKQNAFRQAIEIQVGVLILSERETTNYQLTKNQILAYSSGYVDDFKIVEQHSIGTWATVTVDVWIASSKLSQMFLYNSKSSGVLEGERHSTQYNSYLQNRKDGDAILNNVLENYPTQAFMITQGFHSFKLDAYRNAMLLIPYDIKWSKNYLTSFKEAMALLEEGSNGYLKQSPGNILVVGNGSKIHYRFNDVARSDRVIAALTKFRTVQIKVDIKDEMNTVVYTACSTPISEPFHYTGDPAATVIYSNAKAGAIIQIKIEPKSYLNSILQNTYKVQLSAVPLSACKNN
jgi:hypothetical protein